VRRPALIAAAVAAVCVECAFAWALTSVVPLRRDIAFGVAFAAGYLVLLAVVHVVSGADLGRAVRTHLWAYVPIGLALILIALATLYLCVDIAGLGLAVSNAVALVVVAAWLVLGYPRSLTAQGPEERVPEESRPR
jgi:putative flippase GtrA